MVAGILLGCNVYFFSAAEVTFFPWNHTHSSVLQKIQNLSKRTALGQQGPIEGHDQKEDAALHDPAKYPDGGVDIWRTIPGKYEG